ncbi:MAG: hypothetical protein WBB67_04625 [bacterium]
MKIKKEPFMQFSIEISALFGIWILSRFVILDYIIKENRGSRKAGGFGAYRV